MYKKYIASYVDKHDKCWDLILNAYTWKEAKSDALRQQPTMGKLYSVRLLK